MIETASDDDISWAAKVIGIGSSFHPDARGIVIGDRKAVIVYDNFSECDCSIHVASDGKARWLSRSALLAIFMLPFHTWNLRRVTGLVASKNEKALKLDLHLGFKIEGRLEHALPDDDIILLGMTRQACRFIPPAFRK